MSYTAVSVDDSISPRWREEEIVLISALEHFSYCPRQCALIHVEQIFDENVFTLRGSNAHDRADGPTTRIENGIRMERALPLWSDRWGLLGKGDVVEFHSDGSIVPVEYKHGPRRERRHDDLQLCAQALCLEEMQGIAVERGAVFSLQSKRRREVFFDDDLRVETIAVIASVRALQQETGPLPEAVDDKRCPRCSLIDACMPAAVIAASREARLTRNLFIPLSLEALQR
jgi:CRISPR-associated exonuclease Cas4